MVNTVDGKLSQLDTIARHTHAFIGSLCKCGIFGLHIYLERSNSSARFLNIVYHVV